jgi:hypothetical protein
MRAAPVRPPSVCARLGVLRSSEGAKADDSLRFQPSNLRKAVSPPLRWRWSAPPTKLEWRGRIDELLRTIEDLVGLVRLALESHADLCGGLILVAGGANANGDNVAALNIDLHADQRGVLNFGFHGLKCPQNLPPGSSNSLVRSQSSAWLWFQASFPRIKVVVAVRGPPSEGGALQCPLGQQKSRLLQRLRASKISPLTDSNRRPPPYHAPPNRCRGLPPVADRLV